MIQLKWIVNSCLRNFGYEFRKFIPIDSKAHFLKSLLLEKSIDLVIDVGANTGQYADQVIQFGFGGNIISIEPQSFAHEKLTRRASGYKNWVIPTRMACGSENGEMTIFISANSVSSSVLKITPHHIDADRLADYVGSEKTLVRRLDHLVNSYLNHDTRAHLKIDAQGYEYQVILGATGILSNIFTIQMELSFVPLYESQKLFCDVTSYLRDRGFHLLAVFPEFMHPKKGMLLQVEAFFIKLFYIIMVYVFIR